MANMKTCTKCNIEKEWSKFNQCNRNHDGLQYWCKTCQRQYRHDNKEAIAKRMRQDYQKNKERDAEQKRMYQQKLINGYEERMRDITSTHKTCSKCDMKKTRNEFFVYKISLDGLRSQCKICERECYKEAHAKRKHIRHQKLINGYEERMQAITSTHKICIGCNAKKARIEFSILKTNLDGLRPQCKTCDHQDYQNNKEYYAEHGRKYRQTLAGEITARKAQQRRRAQKQAVPSTLTEQQWQTILTSYGYSCAYCNASWREIKGVLEKDRVIPGIQGGGYTVDNVVCACKSCNSKKSGRTPEQAGMTLHQRKKIDNNG